MNVNRSLAVLDDRTVLVDGILRVAQSAYPDLEIETDPTGHASSPDSERVVVIGGGALSGCPDSQHFLALVASGAALIALVDSAPRADVYALRTAGVGVFVSVSEGMNELLRGIDRAFAGKAHLSPDSEAHFSRPARVAPRISPRERQIVMLYLSENDWSVDDVAGLLEISSQTVRSHLARLRSHFTAAGFRVRNRLELRQTLVELGIIDPKAVPQPFVVPVAQPAKREISRFRYSDDSVFAAKVG